MTDEAAAESDATVLRALCDEARSLADDLPGSLSRLALRAGDHAVEIEWGAAPGPSAERVQAGIEAGAMAAGEQDRDGVAGRSIITAPLVGFFYRCPEPGGRPFVEEGEFVEFGREVAVVEGKNATRHVHSDRAARVVRFLVEDGHMVELGQELVILEAVDASG